MAHWHVGQVRRTVDWKGGFKREHANKENQRSRIEGSEGEDDRNVVVQDGVLYSKNMTSNVVAI